MALKKRPKRFVKLIVRYNVVESIVVMFDPSNGKYSPVLFFDLTAKPIFQKIQKMRAPNENSSAAGIPRSEM